MEAAQIRVRKVPESYCSDSSVVKFSQGLLARDIHTEVAEVYDRVDWGDCGGHVLAQCVEVQGGGEEVRLAQVKDSIIASSPYCPGFCGSLVFFALDHPPLLCCCQIFRGQP